MGSEILLKFLVTIVILFVLPKIIRRYIRLPAPLAEVFLGIVLGLAFTNFFFIDDMISILSTIGIITLFVHSGIEADLDFVLQKKRFFIENIIVHLLLIAAVSWGIKAFLHLPLATGFIIALALTTPSASYIISSVKGQDEKKQKWIEGKALAGEILALILLIFALHIDSLWMLLMTAAVLGVLLFVLPHLLKKLYYGFFNRMQGIEFSFIFVVAMISAFITDFLGVHFLVGAFIAGLVSRRFVKELVHNPDHKHINRNKGRQILEGFNFFATVFIPFYFFKVGLQINAEVLSLQNIIIGISLSIVISAVRLLLMTWHRKIRARESLGTASRVSSFILPTLVFTFVIAEILQKSYGISESLFGTLLIYGVMTALLSMGAVWFIENKKLSSNKNI